MFKVGDIVRVNNTFPGYENNIFRVSRIYISDTHGREVFVINVLDSDDKFDRHFLFENLEMDIIYDRKKKLKKINKKLKGYPNPIMEILPMNIPLNIWHKAYPILDIKVWQLTQRKNKIKKICQKIKHITNHI